MGQKDSRKSFTYLLTYITPKRDVFTIYDYKALYCTHTHTYHELIRTFMTNLPAFCSFFWGNFPKKEVKPFLRVLTRLDFSWEIIKIAEKERTSGK